MSMMELDNPSRYLEGDDIFQMNADAFTSFAKNKTLTPAGDVSVNGVITSVYLNTFIFCVLIGTYEVLRRKFPAIYNGRHRHVPDECCISYELPDTWIPIRWMIFVVNVPWQHVRERCGLDAYMFLRYIRMCLRITFVTGLWGTIILWPVYYYGGGDAEGWYLFSMANLQQGSENLWVPVVFIWVFSHFVFFTMEKEYLHFLKLRMEFLGKKGPGTHPQHHYSILVEKIPPELQNSFALREYFEHLFPDKVHSATVVMKLPDLENMLTRRKRVIHRLEKSLAHYEASEMRPTHRVGQPRLMCCGVETEPVDVFTFLMSKEIHTEIDPPRTCLVDSIKYYIMQLKAINEELLSEQIKASTATTELSSAKNWIAKILRHGPSFHIHVNNNDQIETIAKDESTQTYGALEHNSKQISSDKSEPLLATSNRLEPNDGIQNQEGLTPDHNIFDVPPTLYDSSDHPDFHRDTFTAVTNNMGFDFVKHSFNRMNTNIDKIVDEVIGTKMSSTGFVTFTDLATTACASTAILTEKPDTLTAAVAPEPRDIVWSNAHIPASDIKDTRTITNLTFGIGAIFWSIPLALIQAFATAEELAEIQGLSWILTYNNGTLRAFINGYLPVVALLLLIMMLPIIFELVATKIEKCKTYSGIQNSILTRYFYYQLANVYVSVTAGTIWTALSDIIDHPSNLMTILGQSLPTVVGYFVALLVTKILAGLPMILLRSGALTRTIFLRAIFTKKYLSQREIDRVYRPQYLLYGWEYPTQLLVVVICFTYTCISPVILPFGAAYFGFAFIIYKKQILYLYTPRFESGGTSFPLAMNRTLIGLMCGQVTLIGYLIIRGGKTKAFFIFPLVVITYVTMSNFRKRVVKPSKNLSLERAKEIDQKTNFIAMETLGDNFQPDVASSFNVHAYRQPCLSEGVGEPMPYRHGKEYRLQDEIQTGLNAERMKRTLIWGRTSSDGSP